MIRYLGGRILQAVLVLLGVTFVTFFLLYVLPADPARQIAGRSATPESVQNIREQLGLDKSFFEQFFTYLGNLLQGDLGRSYIQKTDVSELVSSRLAPTLLLMVAAIGLELMIGIFVGVLAARRKGKTTDNVIMGTSFVAVSTPQFIAAILFLFVFAITLEWLPIGGYGTPQHLILPALTLGVLGAGWYGRMVRSSMIEALNQDYARTARAKGASERRIVWVHAFRNAGLPLVALIGIDIGIFMGGIVIVESVFGWPGIGQLAWQAIQRIDIPVIMGVTLIAAIAIVLGNLLADLLAPLIDPRVKLKGGKNR
jgi:peptide/nickel transport system permease protein